MDWRDGQARTAWLNNVLQRYVGDPVDYYLGPTGIPQRVNALTQAAQFTDAGDYAEAVDASRSVWNDPTLANVLRYGTAAGALAIPMVSARMMQDGVDVAGDAARSMSDDASRFWQDESGALTTGADPAVVRADEVLDLLRQGRGAEVTDEMLDMGDPVLNARMNSHLWRNYDLPMDEASRMARAGDTDAFHATRSAENFSQFRPGARGSIYMAATPEGAARGAAGQALEVAASNPVSGTTAIMPLRINSGDVRGLTVNQSAYDALPDVLTESDVPAMAGRIKKAGLEYWDDAYEAVRFGDEYRYYKRDAPTARYQDLEPGRDAWGYRLGAFNTGSDLDSLARAADVGKKGFMVADEGGSSIVASPDMPIRSRFARFDPRLAHLRNLSAGLGGAAVLNGAYGEDEEARRMRELLEYLNQ